ncbi:MAG: thymidine phosphorylase [Ignavibacteriae bacterium]|nr:thymidine phosphorylase [Ignavibacteriota bacterium]
MLAQEIIRNKRNGAALREEELRGFLRGYVQGDVSDAQMSAMLMAVYFRGMTFDETIALTGAYLDSGARLDLSTIPGVTVDKHSTGGVGDKVSLLLAPIVAAAGVPVPMISGRGLGHTGGTLDKLESIPGFRTRLSEAEFTDVLQRCGAVFAGQSETLVPLDRRIYALRDITATVDSHPLIAASIMSKKIAGGAQALVLDVKCGRGAFMTSHDEAVHLAALLCRVGEHFGLRVTGLVTRMDEPLGRAIGNHLEMIETIECLRGEDRADLLDVTLRLAGMMIAEGRKAADAEEGSVIAREMIRSGLAFRKLLDIVEAQGGDPAYIDEPLLFPVPKCGIDVLAERDGYVADIDARTLGLVAVEIGAGRRHTDDVIDPTAGIVLDAQRGDAVHAGDRLCRLYSSAQTTLAPFRDTAAAAFTLTPSAPPPVQRVLSSFDASGVTHTATNAHPL